MFSCKVGVTVNQYEQNDIHMTTFSIHINPSSSFRAPSLVSTLIFLTWLKRVIIYWLYNITFVTTHLPSWLGSMVLIQYLMVASHDRISSVSWASITYSMLFSACKPNKYVTPHNIISNNMLICYNINQCSLLEQMYFHGQAFPRL